MFFTSFPSVPTYNYTRSVSKNNKKYSHNVLTTFTIRDILTSCSQDVSKNTERRKKNMVTKEMFIEKLSEWLTDETCEKLAFEAEQRFTEDRYTSVYELMLLLIGSDDMNDFVEMCEECNITLSDDDDIEGMFEAMAYEW